MRLFGELRTIALHLNTADVPMAAPMAALGVAGRAPPLPPLPPLPPGQPCAWGLAQHPPALALDQQQVGKQVQSRQARQPLVPSARRGGVIGAQVTPGAEPIKNSQGNKTGEGSSTSIMTDPWVDSGAPSPTQAQRAA